MARFVKVAGVRHLFWRGSSLYFRRVVPSYARSHFGGAAEVQISFGRCSLTDARFRLAREVAKFDHKINLAKGDMSSMRASVGLRLPSNIEIDEVVRGWLADRMSRAGESYHEGSEAAEMLAAIEQQTRDVKRGAISGPAGPATTTEWIAEALIEQNYWDIHPGSPAHGHLLRMISRGQREAGNQMRQEIVGDPLRIEDETFGPEQYRLDIERQRERQTNAPVPIFAMFDGYVAEQKPKASTKRAWRRQIERLVDFLEHDDARRYSPGDMLRWKEHLLTREDDDGKRLSARTVKDTYLAAAKTVLGWAAENHHIPSNPMEKIRVRVPKKARVRDPGYSNDEAEAILKAADEPREGKASSQSKFAYRWVPWLCAYTGARVNEITQLRKSDVLQLEGVWAILITPEAGTVKGNSHRYVPLHTALINRGFLVEIGSKPEGPLFFDVARRKTGSDENPQPKKVGERIAKWVRDDVGINDPEIQPNHAWRHRFKSLARKYRMDAETRDYIQGHTPRTEGEGYGSREQVELMAEAIALLP